MAILNTDVLEIIVDGSALAQQIVNVFHYRRVDPAGPELDDDLLPFLVGSFIATWRDNVLPHLSDFYGVDFYRGRVLHDVVIQPLPTPHPVISVSVAHDAPGVGADVGGRTGEAAPTFVAAGVRKLSDRAGRNFRGSYRLSPLTETQITNNTWLAGELAPIQTGQQAFTTTVLLPATGIDNHELVVFSRTLTLSEPVGFSDLRSHTAKVTGASVAALITSQVSRKARPGQG
jgi:hypothetical protein